MMRHMTPQIQRKKMIMQCIGICDMIMQSDCMSIVIQEVEHTVRPILLLALALRVQEHHAKV